MWLEILAWFLSSWNSVYCTYYNEFEASKVECERSNRPEELVDFFDVSGGLHLRKFSTVRCKQNITAFRPKVRPPFFLKCFIVLILNAFGTNFYWIHLGLHGTTETALASWGMIWKRTKQKLFISLSANEQEVHVSHHSPVKPDQINKHLHVS